MKPVGVQDRNLKAAEYLRTLQELAHELERAMQAIARNALAEFEESVANQQSICTRLRELVHDLSTPLEVQTTAMDTAFDRDMTSQVRAASGTLQKLNYRYAALLQHSSRSVSLMASLFSSFKGQFQEASGPRLKHQTWSCQM